MSRAAEKGDEEIVALLLQNGARPDFEDEHGKTPLSRAIDAGKTAVIALLNEHSLRAGGVDVPTDEWN